MCTLSVPEANLFVEVWEQVMAKRLTLDQTDAPIEIDQEQIARFYIPLAQALASRMASSKRLVTAVAGPPGSGKSTFASLLCAVLNAVCKVELAVAVGLDGWHYPNVYLENHSIVRDGRQLPLKALKGSVESFDVLAALAFLRSVRLGNEVSFPVYSRLLHDPQPNLGKVLKTHRLVIFEGNYLLLNEAPWSQFLPLLDSSIWIQTNLDFCRVGLMDRHRRTGKSEAALQRQIQVVDLPNARRIIAGSRGAEFVVEKMDSRKIRWITRWGEEFSA